MCVRVSETLSPVQLFYLFFFFSLYGSFYVCRNIHMGDSLNTRKSISLFRLFISVEKDFSRAEGATDRHID